MNKFKIALHYLIMDFKVNPTRYEDCKEAMDILEKAFKFGQYLFVPISKLDNIYFESKKHHIEGLLTREAKLTFTAKMTCEKKVLNEIGDINYIDEQLVDWLKGYLEQD